MPEVFTIDELAARWKVHYNTIYKMLTDGDLKGFRIGSTWRITASVVETIEKGET